MIKFNNTKRSSFLSSIPTCSIESEDDRIALRCKFNFSYYCAQPAGQTFDQWSEFEIRSLIEKLTNYSKEPLDYWKNQPVGKSGTILAIYGSFPTKSDFSHPSHVPHEVMWGRFRLDHSMRLVGFVIPEKYNGIIQAGSGGRFDSNTFYVVFLDKDHRFWKSSEKK